MFIWDQAAGSENAHLQFTPSGWGFLLVTSVELHF